MKLVLDANVLIAALKPAETHFGPSRDLLKRASTLQYVLTCPTLCLPECAGGIARATDDPHLAGRTLQTIDTLHIDWVPLSSSRAKAVADFAQQCRLRGPDAVYVSLASELSCPLLSWDRELLERGGPAAQVVTPAQWLADAAHRLP